MKFKRVDWKEADKLIRTEGWKPAYDYKDEVVLKAGEFGTDGKYRYIRKEVADYVKHNSTSE